MTSQFPHFCLSEMAVRRRWIVSELNTLREVAWGRKSQLNMCTLGQDGALNRKQPGEECDITVTVDQNALQVLRNGDETLKQRHLVISEKEVRIS